MPSCESGGSSRLLILELLKRVLVQEGLEVLFLPLAFPNIFPGIVKPGVLGISLSPQLPSPVLVVPFSALDELVVGCTSLLVLIQESLPSGSVFYQ